MGGVKLSALKGGTDTLVVPVGDDNVTIIYKPYAVTTEFSARMEDLARSDEAGIEEYLELLLEVLVSWDLLDDDEQPFPITASTLRETPARFLTDVLVEMREAQGVGEAKGGRSARRSSHKGN